MTATEKGASAIGKSPPILKGAIVVYESNGVPILGTILKDTGKKFTILNAHKGEFELTADRLTPIPGSIAQDLSKEAKAERLNELAKVAADAASDLSLETIWHALLGDVEDIDIGGIAELYFGDAESTNYLATYFSLLNDNLFFKRKKDRFSPRTPETVEELKRALETANKRKEKQQALLRAFSAALNGDSLNIPEELNEELRLLEDLAAGGRINEGRTKDARELVKWCEEELGLSLSGTPEDRAFQLLRRASRFTEHENLALIRYRPPLEFTKDALDQAAQIANLKCNKESANRKDLQSEFVFTIDDATTKDMDDAISIEITDQGISLGVHITDVASLIPKDSALDKAARLRATSIYCADSVINMLPSELSQSRMSLVVDTTREAMSFIFQFNSELQLIHEEVYPSVIMTKRRLSYNEVDQILETGNDPIALERRDDPRFDLSSKLSKLNDLTLALEQGRVAKGAAKFDRRDVLIKFSEKGELILEEYDEGTPARTLVAELMILVNGAAARLARAKETPLLFRSQSLEGVDLASIEQNVPTGPALDFALRTSLSKSWTSIDPRPHATLGLDCYAQISSPIRRFVDLVNQRQILAILEGRSAHYAPDELEALNKESEEPLAAARAITRDSKRYWLLEYLRLKGERGENITATVVRMDARITLIELDEVYISMPAKLPKDIRIGDRLIFRIARIEPHRNVTRLDLIGRND